MKDMHKRYGLIAIFLLGLTLFASACGNATSASSSSAPSSFTIAYQPGLGAVTLVTLKHQKTLEKLFPNTTFDWKVVFSGASVRESMIANQVQLGALGLPPFLVGWDRGFNWKVLTASSRSDSWLVTKNPRIKSLKDFTSSDKIGVVAPDSQQAIILRKAAQDQLGDAHALDQNIVAITSEDGEQALLSGQIAAHLSGLPFQQREVDTGGRIILHTTDAFGKVGAGLIALAPNFDEQYPDFTKKVRQAFLDATNYASTHHEEVAQYLSQDQAGGGTAAQFKALLDNSAFVFDTTPSGLITYAKFMQSIGLISKVPGSVKDLEVSLLNGAGS
jgi:NitT/TauT family transport system substrate-binding protein